MLIKKYIDLDKLIIIEAGSLNQDGETTRLIFKKQEQKAVSQYTKETAFCISKGYFFCNEINTSTQIYS